MIRERHKKSLNILIHSSECMLYFTLKKLKRNVKASAGLSGAGWWNMKSRLKHNTLHCRVLCFGSFN